MNPRVQACVFGALAFFGRLPFLFRYDLHFAGDSATCYLMALRIARGDLPFYFYGQDYQGATEAFLAAPLVMLFGPSIPLVATVSLLEWSIATAIAVYLTRRATTAQAAAIVGIVAAVGVPYTLHFVTVPFWGHPGSQLLGMLALLQAMFIMERGASTLRAVLLGATVGMGLYVGKQSVPAFVAAGVALALMRTPHWNPRTSLKSGDLAAGLAGFFAGYLPEIVYRWQHSGSRSFLSLATPAVLWGNLRNLAFSVVAYVDAQPVSRMPEGTYFFSRQPERLVYPANPLDAFMWIVAAATLALASAALVRAYQTSNTAQFVIALPLLVNVALVVMSLESGGSFINVRRYLHPAAIMFSVWTGLVIAWMVEQRRKVFVFGGWLLLTLFVGRIWVHEYALLRAPDELRELRAIIQDLHREGLTRGLASWGYALTISALTAEDVIVAPQEGGRIEDYHRLVAEADRIAVIGRNDVPAADMVVRGIVFRPIANPHRGETLQWTEYRRRPPL